MTSQLQMGTSEGEGDPPPRGSPAGLAVHGVAFTTHHGSFAPSQAFAGQPCCSSSHCRIRLKGETPSEPVHASAHSHGGEGGEGGGGEGGGKGGADGGVGKQNIQLFWVDSSES